MNLFFCWFAEKSSEVVGNIWAFILATLSIIIWLIAGPIFHYSDTWQLLINTLTTVLTFLIVFLIQHTQNRDTKMIQLKLNEIIKSINKADNAIINLDDLSDEQLKKLEDYFKKIKQQ